VGTEIYGPKLKAYLEATFPGVRLERTGRNWYEFGKSNSKLYVVGSMIHAGRVTWSDLEESNFDKLVKGGKSYSCAIVCGEPRLTFVLRSKEVEKFFKNDYKSTMKTKRPLWQFGVLTRGDSFYLHFNKGGAEVLLDRYLNNWNDIPDFKGFEIAQQIEDEVYDLVKSRRERDISNLFVGEKGRMVMQRIGQAALSRDARERYGHQCSLCDIGNDKLLTGAHISPWGSDAANRGNPKNIICLCRFHHEMFDSGILVVDEYYDVHFSKGYSSNKFVISMIAATETKLRKPALGAPDLSLLAAHKNRFPATDYV
jgi:HNH endonuclease